MEEKKQFTVDEWFYHWLADEAKYLLAAKFFLKIFEICDKIVLMKGTRLAHKFYQLDEESGRFPPKQREVVRFIKNQFLANSIKIHWIDEVPTLGEQTEAGLPRKDIYLIEICAQTRDKILITTDITLHQNVAALKPVLGITPFFAHQFIEAYLQS
jgi:hypothetical protein